MKRKNVLSLILILSVALSLLFSGCASGAWFKESAENTTDFELVADGVLLIVIDVPSTVFEGEGTMTPAALMENALREHKYFDVKKLYNVSDPELERSYVKSIATDAVFKLNITFLTGGGTSGTFVKAIPAFGASVGFGPDKRTLKEREISISGDFIVGEDTGVAINLSDDGVFSYATCNIETYLTEYEEETFNYTLTSGRTAIGPNTTLFQRDSVIQTELSSTFVRQSGDIVYFHEGGFVMTSNDIVRFCCTTYLKMCDEEISTDLKNTNVAVEIAITGSEIEW